ncbi:butyrophilin subfamily 1 member A1-like [Myiozetetes cayanensis]|uniref:butyrophilin subfamily 1 member A1-like n=1 Tax=Myiozetetes cayanensis TaxID=478635 RepID=UPI00216085B1|nr:butyrophilin subfamily 1 member A1-like [Myiozetetes cayanensis]
MAGGLLLRGLRDPPRAPSDPLGASPPSALPAPPPPGVPRVVRAAGGAGGAAEPPRCPRRVPPAPGRAQLGPRSVPKRRRLRHLREAPRHFRLPPPDRNWRALPGNGELQDLKNELEKRQARNNPKIPELSQPECPAQQQEEEENQQDNQDVKSSASRGGKVTFQLPPDAAPGSEERICHFSWRSNALKETLRKLQASVTLDPATAHPELELSADGKSVRRGARARPVPDSPERFDYWPFVLGRPCFAGGRHCWAVDVGDGGDWAVGVARDSIARKGRLSLGPQGGIWAVERWGGQLRALTPRRATPVPLRWPPRRVSVHLDCAGGTVAFFDAEAGGLLFLFSRAAFAGERLRPWLWVVGAGSQLRLCP